MSLNSPRRPVALRDERLALPLLLESERRRRRRLGDRERVTPRGDRFGGSRREELREGTGSEGEQGERQGEQAKVHGGVKLGG